jgi:alpha-1,3-mannosyltransferase
MNVAIYADDYTGNRGISVVGYEILIRLLEKPDLNFLVIGNRKNINIFNKRFGIYKNKIKASVRYHTYKNSYFRSIKKKFLDYHVINDIDNFWFMKNYGTYRLIKRSNIIVTVHDLMGYLKPNLQGGKKSILRTLNRILNVKTLKYADILITVSNYTASQMRKKIGVKSNKIKVIPNCVNSDNFTPGIKNRCILYAGAFNEYKNLERLIDLFLKSELKSKGWKLNLIGPNSKVKGCLKNQICKTHANRSSIKILPEVSNYMKLKNLYKKAYCVVSMSKYEGFGLSILEGMSAGARIIASNIGPHKEIVGNSNECQLLDINNDSGWINAFNNLEKKFLNDNSYSKLNRKISMKYNWETVAEQYYKILCK